MFQAALREIVDHVEGGVAGLIMDSEGIAVDSYARADAPFDINVVGIEFGVVLGSIKRAAESLEAGKAHEVARKGRIGGSAREYLLGHRAGRIPGSCAHDAGQFSLRRERPAWGVPGGIPG